MSCFKEAYWSTTVTIPKWYSQPKAIIQEEVKRKNIPLLYFSSDCFQSSPMGLQWCCSYLSASCGAESSMVKDGDYSWRQTEDPWYIFFDLEVSSSFHGEHNCQDCASTGLWTHTTCVWNQSLSLAIHTALHKLWYLSNLFSSSEKWRK